ncbi:MAG: 2-phosphosulfolactate phosphatase [Bacteroidales bacterium]|nr:2-phosphosulfolactate phosphatase [Bacteroidales bacterium]
METQQIQPVEVCFSPAVFDRYFDPKAVILVTDILRASSAICTAMEHGVKEIVPVPGIEEARKYKENGFIVAAERDGTVLDFADFGNSPWYFMEPRLKDKTVAYSTTNGTNAIQMAAQANKVIIGSFLNLKASCDYLKKQNRKVIILCAGWKQRFSLEDAVHAGAVAECLLQDKRFETDCDSAKAAVDLWQIAKPGLYQYILKAAQKKRLAKLGLDDVIKYCHTPDQSKIIPVFDPQKNRIVDSNKL